MRSVLVSTALVLSSAVLAAHHSSAGIDRTKSVELVGTIKQFSWTNPHSWMEVEVPDQKGGTVVWKVEMTSPAYLVRAGWKSTTVKTGDEVKVTVRPLRSVNEKSITPSSGQLASGAADSSGDACAVDPSSSCAVFNKPAASSAAQVASASLKASRPSSQRNPRYSLKPAS